MTELTIVTPTHAPDLAAFTRLRESVVRFAGTGIRHLAVVPTADAPLFDRFRADGLELLTQRGVLPRRIRETTGLARLAARTPHAPRGARIAAVDLAHPLPPLRGWILQQLVKYAVAAALPGGAAVFIDSDVELIRPVEVHDFVRADGAVRFYRRPGGVTADMRRHENWHRVARRMIGAAPLPGPHSDFIAGIVSWDVSAVRDCLARVSAVAGRPWTSVIGARADFSEFVLYGEYLTECGTERQLAFASDDPLCHSYWTPRPMSLAEARGFLDTLPSNALAIHVQSNSSTSDEVMRYLRAALPAH